jgi:hypothetical protein
MEKRRIKVTYKRIPDHIFEICEFIRLSPRPSKINQYFVPSRVILEPPQLKNGSLIQFIDGRRIDRTEDLYTVHRKIKCTNCNSIKWADEFDWNRKGFEGPYKQHWGKRDCWCKACRSKTKSTTYKSAKAVKAQKLKRSKTLTVMDVDTATITETHTDDQQIRQSAYHSLLEQVFYRMTH